MGRVTKTTDPEGHYVESFFDSRGNRIRSVSFNLGVVEKAQERWKYDASGRLAESARLAVANTLDTTDTDPATDQVTEYTYDHDGRRLTMTTYNSDDGVTGLVTRSEYDAIGRPSKTIDAMENYTESIYITTASEGKPLGALDRQVIVDIDIDPNTPLRAREIHFYYDDFARLNGVSDRGEGTGYFDTEWVNDDGDRRTLIADPLNIQTKYVYDALGHRTQVIEAFGDPLARTTDYAYDKLGRLETITAYDPAAQVTTYEYDLVGRRTKIFYPDEGTGGEPLEFVYDKAGRMTGRIDRRFTPDQVVTYTYDKRGLMATRFWGLGFDAYVYDGLGRMTSATRSGLQGSTTVFAYNDLSQLDYEDQSLFLLPAKRMDYDYDQAGNRKEFIYPSDVNITLTMNVDALNRVEDITRTIGLASGVQIVDYDYEGLFLSRRRLFTDYEGQSPLPTSHCPVWVDYIPTYDGHRRMTNITNKVSSAYWTGRKLSNNDHTYDNVGNRTHIEPAPIGSPDANYDSSGLQKDIQYDYDNLHRLWKTTYNTDGSPAPYEQFDMDPLSNRTDYTQRDLTVLSYEDNDANEYTKIGTPLPGTENVYHDAAGNMTGDDRDYGYQYDFENRLIRVFKDTTKNGQLDHGEAILADYVYDAVGRRIASTVQTSIPLTQHYYYDGQNVVAEYRVKIVQYLSRYFVHGTQYIDERVLMHKIKGDDDFYYFTRELWSIEGLVNNRGHEVEHYSYDAYGMPVITAVPVADVSYDGTVWGDDIPLILGSFGSDPCTQAPPIYDINDDGAIDSKDLTAINKAWGDVLVTISESGIDNPYAFTARRMDFSDYVSSPLVPQLLHYHSRGREYDPLHGRFLQRDPAEYIDGMNLYEYVSSSPASNLDPSGLQKSELTTIAAMRRTHSWETRIVALSYIDVIGSNVGTFTDPTIVTSKTPKSMVYWARQLAEFTDDYFGSTVNTDIKPTGKRFTEPRLWTRVTVTLDCCRNKISNVNITDKDMMAGDEPYIWGGGTINLGNLKFSGTNKRSSRVVSWIGSGRPDWNAEKQFEAITTTTGWTQNRPRHIWHAPEVKVSCDNYGGGKHSVKGFTASKFPSHKLFIQGQEVKFKRQQSFDNLWIPHPTKGSDFVI